ncbi:hypothetical protein OQA88_226 [Cercophora sp. LCS_1]
MPPPPISSLLRTWYKWKMLRLPWRRKFLVGSDLQGNTFWEFRVSNDPGFDGRWRRIVHYPRKTHHGDVKVSPAWHQWLRNTRKDPPTLEEQEADVIRQERMKMLAAEADARWETKGRLVGSPAGAPGQPMGQPVPVLGTGIAEGTGSDELSGRVPKEEPAKSDEVKDAKGSREETWRKMRDEEEGVLKGKGPWKQAAPSGPGETWQPKAWQSGEAKKR